MRSVVAILLLTTGCGIGWIDGESSSDGLPSAGIGPYGRPDPDDNTPALEPWLLTDLGVNFSDPSALSRGDSGLKLWFTRTPVDGTPQVWRAEVPSITGVVDVEPQLALAADLAWEQGAVAAPSVTRDPANPQRLVMYYQGGVNALSIGRAVSVDDGASWSKDATPVLANAQAPAGLATDNGWVVFAVRTEPELAGIWRASGEPLVWDSAPIITARPELADAFDRVSVGDPVAISRARPTGTASYGLWFTGTANFDGDPAIAAVGYAGSFDGVSFTRLPDEDPVLLGNSTGPSVVLRPSGNLMLFADTYRRRLAIGVALPE